MSFWKTGKFWTIVGSVGTVVTLVIGTVPDPFKRPRSLTSQLVEVLPLLNESAKLDGKLLQIFLGNEPISHFAIAKIRVKNNGGSPFLVGDFQGPFQFSFKNVSKIYFVDPGRRRPKSLDPVIIFDANTVRIDPLILNQGDMLNIDAGIEISAVDQPVTMETRVRIAGLKDVHSLEENKKIKRNREKSRKVIVVIMGSISVMAIFSAIWWFMKAKWQTKVDRLSRKNRDLELDNAALRQEKTNRWEELLRQLGRTLRDERRGSD